MTTHHILIKRIYEKATAHDGYRILVDRLWPRGISKSDATVDLWLKDIAPSNELRIWFHKTQDWYEFEKKYNKELSEKSTCLECLKHFLTKKNITLLYSSTDEIRNNAIVLKNFLAHTS